jgi:hypothetical protein
VIVPKDRTTRTDHGGHMNPDDTVIDLRERRERLTAATPIPDHVRDEMEAAARLWHELRAEGKEVRFRASDFGGRVLTLLGDLDGPGHRVVPLHEAIAPNRDDDPGDAA